MKIVCRILALYVFMSSSLFAERHEQTVLEYAQQCINEIGDMRAFDCSNGTNIPITVNGKLVTSEIPHQCDRPSLLSPTSDFPGQCAPYSKIRNLSYGDTQISVYCKRNTLLDDKDVRYDEVNVVLHNTGNGKTCWFQSADGRKDTSRVPPPNEKVPPAGKISAVEFWKSPGDVFKNANCVTCHDAGPYIMSPYIAQVWHLVPTDPWGKYSNIGPAFEGYHLDAINTAGNTCTGCHRIGSRKSCDVFLGFATGNVLLPDHNPPPGNNQLANTYPLSHWMPADNNMSEAQWNEANIKSVKALLSCCNDKLHKDPNCMFTPITTSNKRK
ncbi:hypothetical protein OKW43_008091 [Paraburkholderia sp. WC7.3g]|uniref:hypothetical protein n=1 Tax=Paraburkholderia sp. WC7.3g TaxID=2991070 RepID=UPI003D1C2ED2